MKIFMLLVLVSCAGGRVASNEPRNFHIVHVDAISESNTLKRFKIVSGMPNLKDTDLRFKQLAKVARNALLIDGFVEDEKAPEVKIALTFQIGDAETTTTQTTAPVFGVSNSQVSNTFGQNVGSVRTFGQTGTRTSSSSRTLYVLKVGLSAVSVKTKTEVWVTNIESVGLTQDLVEVFPYMVFGATGHYGTSSKDKYNVKIGDPRVEALRAPASN